VTKSVTEPIKKKGSWGGKHQSEKQKKISSETLKRLRREYPEKFVHHKKKTVQPVTPPAEVKPEVKIETPAAPIPVPIPPPPPPAPIAIPPVTQSQLDTVLFGPEEVQPPKLDAGPPPAPPPQPPPGSPGTGSPQTPTPPAPPEVRKYAVLVWGMIVKTCCAIFGDGFKPILMKTETGEILYDENAEGVKVWWNWLVSIGVRAFSPVVELWMFMVSYFAIRFPLIVARFRKKKPAASPPATAPEPKTQSPPPPKSEEEVKPEPESKAPQPPPQATPEEAAAALEEIG
jgi:hypothetical protein